MGDCGLVLEDNRAVKVRFLQEGVDARAYITARANQLISEPRILFIVRLRRVWGVPRAGRGHGGRAGLHSFVFRTGHGAFMLDKVVPSTVGGFITRHDC